MKIIAYTDGGARGNGGDNTVSGWGAYLIFGEHKKEIYGSEIGATNQRMELMGCLKALENINTNKYPIEIHTDSAYLCNCFKQKWYIGWEKNNWRNSKKETVANRELWEQILYQIRSRKLNVEFIKVKGHNGIEGNEVADMLCNKAMDELQVELDKQSTQTSLSPSSSKIVYNKLVRDNIPKIIQDSGKTCKTKVFSNSDYALALEDKIQEELKELKMSHSNQESIEELADILEVVHALIKDKGYRLEEVEEIRLKKKQDKGGFNNRICLLSVEE